MTRVENETRHYPDLVDHREDLRQVVNGAYESFALERPWPWLRRRAPLYAFADFTPTDVELVAGVGDRTLEFSGFVGTAYPDEDSGLFRQLIAAMAQGGELHVKDPTDRDFGAGFANFELAPFAIERAINQGEDTARVVLDPRCVITVFGDAEDRLEVRFPRILCPTDCKSVIAVRDEDGNELAAITPGEERRAVRPGTAPTRRPGWVLEDFGMELRHPAWVDESFSGGSANLPTAHSPFVYQREAWPVLQAPTLVFGTDVDGQTSPPTYFLSGSRIRVFVCWFWGGRFGPPSPIVEGTAPGDSNDGIEVIVSGYPILPETSGTIEYGRRIAIFVSEGEGAFFMRRMVTSTAASTTISTHNYTTSTPGLQFPRHDEIYPGGPYTYIRLHPRPAEYQRLELEYYAHPRKLVEDSDSPEFRDNHEVIVWLAVAQMLASPRYNGNPAGALMMAEKYRQAIGSHNQPQDRYTIRRGQVDRAFGTRDFFVPPDIDWIP